MSARLTTAVGKAPTKVVGASMTVRAALGLFAALLIYDGAVRKWALPGMEEWVFVVKDGLLSAVLIVIFAGRRGRAQAELHPGSALLLYLYVFWVALEAFNPRLPNALVGLWGMKSHLLYAGLILLVPVGFTNLKHLLTTLERIYFWVVAPVVGVALVQLAAPAYSALNQTVRGGAESVAQFGYAGLVRVTGTFSYLSGMASFVQISTLLGLALFVCGARSKTFLAGLAFAMLSVPVTGSRSVIVVLVVGATIILCAAAVCRLVSGSHAVLIATVLAALSVVSLYSQDAAWRALVERAENSRADQDRSITTFTNAFEYFESAGPIGFGAGAANLGAPSLTRDLAPFSWLPYGSEFEQESGRTVIELGVIGWALSIALHLAIAAWGATLAFAGRTRIARAAAVLSLPIVVLAVYQGHGVFAPPIAPAFYWLCVAILAMANREDKLAGTRSWPSLAERHSA